MSAAWELEQNVHMCNLNPGGYWESLNITQISSKDKWTRFWTRKLHSEKCASWVAHMATESVFCGFFICWVEFFTLSNPAQLFILK